MRTENTITQKLSALYLFNNMGVVNPRSPFQLFGPQPGIGSFLMLGSTEWLNKDLHYISIHINWLESSLPKSFAAYYKAYTVSPAYNNDSFKINCSVVHNNTWHLLHTTPLHLFEEQEGLLLPIRSIEFQVNKNLFIANPQTVTDALGRHQIPGNGFIKIELVAPEEGFGHSLYAVTLANAALQNAKGHKVSMPSVPYCPVVEKIEVGMIVDEG